MSIKMLKPTTPGQRGMSKQGFEEITSSTPERSLLRKRNRTGGRSNTGRITTRHIGGGQAQGRNNQSSVGRALGEAGASIGAFKPDIRRGLRAGGAGNHGHFAFECFHAFLCAAL